MLACVRGIAVRIAAFSVLIGLMGCSDNSDPIEQLQQSSIKAVEISCPGQAAFEIVEPATLTEIELWAESIQGPVIGSFVGASGSARFEFQDDGSLEIGIDCMSQTDLFGLIYVGSVPYKSGYQPNLGPSIPLTSKGNGTPSAPLL